MSKKENITLKKTTEYPLNLEVNGGKYKTKPTEKFSHRMQWKNPDSGEVYAQIAGTIRQIFIEPNTEIKRGDKMLILEAMKMHNEIFSPVEGTIEKIPVAIGQNVAKGDLLVKIKQKSE